MYVYVLHCSMIPVSLAHQIHYQIRYSLNKNFDDQKVVTISSKTVVRKTVKKIAVTKRQPVGISIAG